MEQNNMLTLLFEAVALGFFAGIIAAVYRGVLAYKDLLNWFFKFGSRYEGKWFYPAIWGCVPCISGQFGLWTYLVLKILPVVVIVCRRPAVIDWADALTYHHAFAALFSAVLAVCCSITTGVYLFLYFEKNKT